MSKSALKAEDIFLGLQKTNENKNRVLAKAKAQSESEPSEPETPKPEENAPEPEKKVTEPASKKKASSTGRKRGPVADPENAKRVPVNVRVPVEVKYGATALINEMKMRGIKESYNLTDFVLEAIEEKIKRTKKQLDLE